MSTGTNYLFFLQYKMSKWRYYSRKILIKTKPLKTNKLKLTFKNYSQLYSFAQVGKKTDQHFPDNFYECN